MFLKRVFYFILIQSALVLFRSKGFFDFVQSNQKLIFFGHSNMEEIKYYTHIRQCFNPNRAVLFTKNHDLQHLAS